MDGLTAILALSGLAAALGLLLGLAAQRLAGSDDPVIERIDALLPQTQCAQCGYPGCRPYADAIARGEADINRCAPGGNPTIAALAELLGRDPLPLADDVAASEGPVLAVIDEARCIGCTLCIQACPVDAILGAPKQMHTVIAAECTGCELCLPPCPVDCIDLVAAPSAGTARRWREPELPAALRPVRRDQAA